MTPYLIWRPFPSFRSAIEATQNLPSKQGAPGECPTLQATGLGPTLYLPLHTRSELSTRNQRQTLQQRKKPSYATSSKHSRVDWCVTRRLNFTSGPDFANGQGKNEEQQNGGYSQSKVATSIVEEDPTETKSNGQYYSSRMPPKWFYL
jgi:hypothetical protein